MKLTLLLGTLVALSALAKPAMTKEGAELMTKKVGYEIDQQKFEAVLIHERGGGARPGLLLVPNWMGITEANVKQAQEIAARGYVVLVADMFGVGRRPKSADEAGKAAGALKADRPLMRARAARALELLLAQKEAPLDPRKVGAIGFCFGGTAALELARSGARLSGVVSFHGGLSTPTPGDARKMTAKVLALHGADDPFVPADEVKAFEEEMRAAKVDWQLVAFGNAVHSFTEVSAARPGQAEYNATVAKRAMRMMDAFFDEVFSG